MRLHLKVPAAVMFLLAGCGGSHDGPRTTINVTGPATLKCLAFVTDSNGVVQTISADHGGSTTVGNVTYTFTIDCSRVTNTTTNTTTPAGPAP